MYVRLLTTIDRRPDLFPERDRLVHLIKLITNEGVDHFQRFCAVKEQLAGLAPEQYLRPLDRPSDQLTAGPIELGDQNYAVLLDALSASFALGDRAGGALLEQSRRAMLSLHETNHLLTARGVTPPFTLPDGPVGPSGTGATRRAVRHRGRRRMVPGWVALPLPAKEMREGRGHVYDVITLSSHKKGRADLKIVLTQSVARYTSMFSQEPVTFQAVFVGRTPDR